MKILALLISVTLCGCSFTPQFALANFPPQTPEQKALRANCKQCQSVARKAENDTYKQARSEMKSAHKAEQKRIDHQCDAEVVPLPVVDPVAPFHADIEVLPESGVFKGIQPHCKDGKCK